MDLNLLRNEIQFSNSSFQNNQREQIVAPHQLSLQADNPEKWNISGRSRKLMFCIFNKQFIFQVKLTFMKIQE